MAGVSHTARDRAKVSTVNCSTVLAYGEGKRTDAVSETAFS